MTDMEMVRLAAEAMGYDVDDEDAERGLWCHLPAQHGVWYRPLHDKAQAFELVERFWIQIQSWGPPVSKFRASIPQLYGKDRRGNWSESVDDVEVDSKDISRAIVECVAKMTQTARGRVRR